MSLHASCGCGLLADLESIKLLAHQEDIIPKDLAAIHKTGRCSHQKKHTVCLSLREGELTMKGKWPNRRGLEVLAW